MSAARDHDPDTAGQVINPICLQELYRKEGLRISAVAADALFAAKENANR